MGWRPYSAHITQSLTGIKPSFIREKFTCEAWESPECGGNPLMSIFRAFCFLAFATVAFGQSVDFIGGVWSGNVSPTSAMVVARFNASGHRVRLHVSQNGALTQPVYSAAVNTVG